MSAVAAVVPRDNNLERIVRNRSIPIRPRETSIVVVASGRFEMEGQGLRGVSRPTPGRGGVPDRPHGFWMLLGQRDAKSYTHTHRQTLTRTYILRFCVVH